MASIAAKTFGIGDAFGRIVAQRGAWPLAVGHDGRDLRWNLGRDWILFIHRSLVLMV